MWYFFYNQKNVGPVSLEKIIHLIQKGVIVNTTLVWQPQQARRQAGQVPELAQYFQQSSRPRPQPVSQTTSAPPIPKQGQTPGTQQQASMENNSQTSSTEKKKELHFQTICFLAVINCSIISILSTLCYSGRYDILLDILREYGYIEANDLTPVASFSIAFYQFAFLACIPIVFNGITQQRYTKAIICVVIAFVAYGFYNYTDSSKVDKKHEVKQQQNTIPYYDEVVKLNKLLISEQRRMENLVEQQDSGLVKIKAQRAITQLRELYRYNTETMEMMNNNGNETSIKFRVKHANQKFSQIQQQFDRKYDSRRPYRSYRSYRNRE